MTRTGILFLSFVVRAIFRFVLISILHSCRSSVLLCTRLIWISFNSKTIHSIVDAINSTWIGNWANVTKASKNIAFTTFSMRIVRRVTVECFLVGLFIVWTRCFVHSNIWLGIIEKEMFYFDCLWQRQRAVDVKCFLKWLCGGFKSCKN